MRPGEKLSKIEVQKFRFYLTFKSIPDKDDNKTNTKEDEAKKKKKKRRKDKYNNDNK